MSVLHSFFIKNIFYDEMDLRSFYFHVMEYSFIVYALQEFRIFFPEINHPTYLSLTEIFSIGCVLTKWLAYGNMATWPRLGQ